MFQTMEDAGFLAEDKMKHVLFSDDLKEMEGFFAGMAIKISCDDYKFLR